MNLVRAGHYHTPSGDVFLQSDDDGCSTAVVTHVYSDELVSVTVHSHDGSQQYGRERVRVGAPLAEKGSPPSNKDNSFHLSGDCPWKR